MELRKNPICESLGTFSAGAATLASELERRAAGVAAVAAVGGVSPARESTMELANGPTGIDGSNGNGLEGLRGGLAISIRIPDRFDKTALAGGADAPAFICELVGYGIPAFRSFWPSVSLPLLLPIDAVVGDF